MYGYCSAKGIDTAKITRDYNTSRTPEERLRHGKNNTKFMRGQIRALCIRSYRVLGTITLKK